MPRLSKIGAAALAAFGWSSGGASAVTASYLVVAGGGAGGGSTAGHGGGGGGAGGYRTGTASLNPLLSYTVTVGAGGAGALATGASGSNSTFNSITSAGGGGGGINTGAGVAGGSGGGGGPDGTPAAGGAGNTPSTSPVQGYAGGQGITDNASYSSTGGGGGSSAVGSAGVNGQSGAGGAGTSNSITGSAVTYAGGGGGGQTSQSTFGAGGAGGGGAGGTSGAAGNSGTANLGGGGGGNGVSNATQGGNGGSGIVIISYAGAQQFGGGVVTSVGGNTIHTFTTSGTLSPITSLSASYLVVAGGGGGGYAGGGGGGAGGLLSGSGVTIDPNSTYLVTVGAGGAGGTSTQGTSGANSSFSMVTTSSVGGGGGGQFSGAGNTGLNGGSGGGGGNTGAAGTGTSGQGFAGSNGGGLPGAAGAGGGASAVGGTSTANNGGIGGAGAASSISGTSVTYAGGGGAYGGTNGGAGGSGGGGSGGNSIGISATSGTANLGGGGGGGAFPSGTGGAGGSGVVIISYPGSTAQMSGGTVTIVGGNTIHTFTSSGYLSPIVLLNRSLRFRSSASAYLNRTPATAGNRQTWTWSAWVKRGKLGATQGLFARNDASVATYISFTSSDTLTATSASGAVEFELVTTQVFRDPSAWYHIAVALDTTQATSSNRVKMYVNGTQITAFSTASYPSQNYSAYVNTAATHYIGNGNPAGSLGWYSDQYLTEINFIDGQALTPSSFGSFNAYGSWSPVRYGGSYGTNGFYLPFTNNASTTTLGYDFSPNGNNWTTNNISLTAGSTYDSMTDVPTLTSATAANYTTLNPLNSYSAGLSNANLKFADGSGNAYQAYATMVNPDIVASSFYCEVTVSESYGIGIAPATKQGSNSTSDRTGFLAYYSNGSKFNNTSSSAYGATFTNGDVIGIAMGGGAVTFYKNGVSQGVAFSSLTGAYMFGTWAAGAAGNGVQFNFGQRPFVYTPPSGFVALNTYNL